MEKYIHYCEACGVIFENDALLYECPCCGNNDSNSGIQIKAMEPGRTECRKLTNVEKKYIKQILKHDVVMHDGINDLWKFKGSGFARVFYKGRDCVRFTVVDFDAMCTITDGRIYMPWFYMYENPDGTPITIEPMEWKGKDGMTGYREYYRIEM